MSSTDNNNKDTTIDGNKKPEFVHELPINQSNVEIISIMVMPSKPITRLTKSATQQPPLFDLTQSDSANQHLQQPQRTPIVWVVQDNGKFNLIGAQKFGELKTLLPMRVQIHINSSDAVNTMHKSLADFNDTDSILAIGDPAAIGIAAAVAAGYNDGIIHILKFDRQTNEYYRVAIDIGSIAFITQAS